ncbi:three-helix bundle dimerization domain-containing protein [Rhodococcus qingshengii]|uniref:three-helix bundle dimerization domain-containing protein n=1 Tax=Rhodococcus qingshengii TaxID=334542 RepID=UPI003D269E50
MTPAEEERHLVRITERLHTKFPHATTEAINSSVTHAYARFDGTPIRDYIPVLVERRAREQLQELATTQSLSDTSSHRPLLPVPSHTPEPLKAHA